ncbi:MAG: serine hydrolase [Candidatus Doudnabacteria bacterium]|nr:serine hydrolase [Candidatus Doudnabacteria bacterium]
MAPNWEAQIKQINKLSVLGKQQERVSDTTAAPELAAFIEKPQITAKSVLAYDFSSGSMLYTQNFDEKLPVASLTKLITAMVIADSGKLDEFVVVQEEDTKVIGANTGLFVDEKIRVSELLKATLIASHNDSTMALARYVGGTVENFVRLMNQKAKEIGMTNTHFANPVGFDDPNHYSSALDISLAVGRFLSYDMLNQIVRTPETEIKASNVAFSHKITTTNKLLLEDKSIIGVKTGYTTEAKGNLVIRSVRNNADVVTIVLGSDDREGDTRKILDWIYTVYRW